MQFELFVFWFLLVLLPELMECLCITSLTEMQLTSDLRDIEGAVHFALHALLEEISNLFWSVIVIVQIKLGERLFLLILSDHVLIRVDVGPS